MTIAPLDLGPGNQIGYKANAFIRELEDLGNGFFFIDFTNNRTGKSHAYRQAVVRAKQRDWGNNDWYWNIVVQAKNSTREKTNIYSYRSDGAPNYLMRGRFDVHLPRAETIKVKEAVLSAWRLLWL